MYQRTGRRMVSRVRRGSVNRYWLESGVVVTTTVTSAAPASNNLLASIANSDYDVKMKGATLITCVGRITAVETTAVGVNTDSTLLAGLVVAQSSTTLASLDPTSASGRVQPWLWREYWQQPTTVALPNIGQTVETSRMIQTKARRRFRTNDEDLILVMSVSGGVAATFQVRYNIRCLVQFP